MEKRSINLTKSRRKEIKEQRQIEHAISLFLDPDQDRTVSQIAGELGISVSALKRLTNDPRFQLIYDETLMGISHHPRLKAMQSSLPELLPASYRKLHQLLTGDRVADTAAVQAIKLLFETLNLKDAPPVEDPQNMLEFMKSRGIVVGGDVNINMNLPIPDAYKAAFSKLVNANPDIVEGVVNTSGSELPSTVPSVEDRTSGQIPPGD